MLEDDTTLGRGIQLALQDPDVTIALTGTLSQAREMLAQKKFDLLILDVNLPDGSALDLLREVRQGEAVPVILLTANDLEMDVVTGLESGADDYITKPFGMMEFLARVKAVLRRSGQKQGEKELHCGSLTILVERHEVQENGRLVELTLKEFEVLKYLVENKGIVLTRDQLLGHVWGYDFDGETRTVDVHIRSLRQKLGDAGALIETVRGVGYRIGELK